MLPISSARNQKHAQSHPAAQERAIRASFYLSINTSEGKLLAQGSRATTANQHSSSHSDVQQVSSDIDHRSQPRTPMRRRAGATSLIASLHGHIMTIRIGNDDADRLLTHG
jgi:hypothetical protein